MDTSLDPSFPASPGMAKNDTFATRLAALPENEEIYGWYAQLAGIRELAATGSAGEPLDPEQYHSVVEKLCPGGLASVRSLFGAVSVCTAPVKRGMVDKLPIHNSPQRFPLLMAAFYV